MTKSAKTSKTALKLKESVVRMKCLRTEEAAQQPYEEVSARLQSDLRNGLHWDEVDNRHKVYGYNELEVKAEEPLWRKYIDQALHPLITCGDHRFKNPLIILLLASALVS
ncbi:unnamed protein product, partial [Oppiella nova]